MIEVLKQALDALECGNTTSGLSDLRQVIAELESQKPVAVWELFDDGWDSIADPEWMESLPIGTKLYTHPPQRTEPVDYEKLAALGWQAIECGICGGGAMGYPQRPRVVFPTMLRKMWSGGEVQAWLDENVNKEKNT